mgnify:CR=1 FL=1
MPKIQQLSPHVADLIAAGEVVERPASAAKELVENAIDAGAHKVTVELRDGGMTFLRVTDDGCGMAAEDVETAFLRHATSKIMTAGDLLTLRTLGFRGEALPSIASVSHFNLLTREEGAEFATSITIDGAPFTLCGQVQSVSVVTDRSITMSFALIVPDAVFDHYTQGDYDVYLDGVLAPSMTEGKSLMNAIADMNALLDPLGLKYESYLQNLGRELFYIVAASYLTIYLAIIFLVVANTIIGVQFLMGQQKAARRYRTLVRLGAEHDTLCRAAKAQINWYFGLPVGVAAVSSLFGVRALFSGILSGSAQSGMTEMMIAAGAMILLLCVVEWLYMAAVKRSSSRYLLGLMAPEREE